MSIVFAKCTNCGAVVQVENTMDAAICPQCGSAYIVEKAVRLYNAQNGEPSVGNVYGGNSADFVIRAGTLVKYTGASTVVSIPNTVKIIGEGAFGACEALESVVIPESVTKIGDSAFCRCKALEYVVIPDSVTEIGSGAFSDCESLKNVVIPDVVKIIGSGAFRGCEALTSVNIPNGVTKIDSGTFEDCKSLVGVDIPGTVEYISLSAFSGCENLSWLSLGEGVKEIQDEAFYRTALTEVIFPQSLESIGHGAGDNYGTFADCRQLSKLTFKGNTEIGWSFGACPITTVEASEEWKQKYCIYLGCLASYRPKPQSGGCYIATAVYGSYDCPPVWTLRRFRDRTLAATWYGRAFVRCYYAVSPTLVKWFGHTAWFRRIWKGRLDALVAKLQARGVEHTPYCDRMW